VKQTAHARRSRLQTYIKRRDNHMDINFGIWSLIPPILAVALAFLTKNVILSLFVSLFSGCLILAYGNPWTALQTTFSDYLFVDMTSGSNAQTIVLMAVIGGFVALVEKSGGARAFARAISNKLTKPVSAQLACWLGGLAIYFSDSGNSLILGPIFRPVFDKLKVSRAKLSYILDSTSSPVCILIPITGWGVYVMNIIATQYEAIGIEGSDAGTFMQAIPYQFYAILALVLIPVIALSKKNFGPMARSEQLALKGLTEEQMKSEDAIVVEDDKEVSMWNMLLPLIVLFIVIFAMFIGWGWPTHNIAGSKIRIALTSGYLLAAITCLIMIVKQKLMTFQQAFDIFVGGIQKMGSILAVIVVAWGVGSVCGTLGTSTFIVESTTGTLSPALVPGLLFIIGAVIYFAIGSSWGTMAILLPIGINMAYSFGLDFPLVIAAVLSGSLFGDHCSPISDTTIMSSMAAGCNHIEHVKTQLPYAMVAAGGSFITYLIVGFADMSAAIALPIAIVVALVLYFLCCKLFVKKAA
jgi:Na+/H+ antiporter NhaC